MLLEDRQLIESIIAEGDANRDAEDLGAAKQNYLKALEELDRIKDEPGGSEMSPEDQALVKKIHNEIGLIDVKLAAKHKEIGIAAFESKDYTRAIDELEEAINLASENDLSFLEEVKKVLDKARLKDRDQKIFEEVSPFVSRGDDFRKSGNHAEGMLEYQEAAKILSGMPVDHRFLTYVKDALRDCRRNLVRPYLTKIYRASTQGKFRKAYQILQRVMILVDEKDAIYRAFLDQIKADLSPNLTKEEIEEDEANPETWDNAVAEYEEALNLYSSYSVTDPFAPAYTSGNVYEDRFLKSRRNLADLYRKRAEKLAETAQIQKALRNYKEALKLYPRADRLFHETFRAMKRLRAQLTGKE